jgi:hypothetical protein
MTTAQEIIAQFDETINNQDPSLMQKIQVQAARAQMAIHDIHARAIACHCECLGMNAENCAAAALNAPPPFGDLAYIEVMQKWGLVDDDNKSII